MDSTFILSYGFPGLLPHHHFFLKHKSYVYRAWLRRRASYSTEKLVYMLCQTTAYPKMERDVIVPGKEVDIEFKELASVQWFKLHI